VSTRPSESSGYPTGSTLVTVTVSETSVSTTIGVTATTAAGIMSGTPGIICRRCRGSQSRHGSDGEKLTKQRFRAAHRTAAEYHAKVKSGTKNLKETRRLSTSCECKANLPIGSRFCPHCGRPADQRDSRHTALLSDRNTRLLSGSDDDSAIPRAPGTTNLTVDEQ
jgi:predicted amidophosphoribosyltransferase